jgi:flagellar protein FlbD
MIQLTRLNRARFYLNPDLIKEIDASPDTVLVLTTGEKMLVLESASDVLDEILSFRKQLQSPCALPLFAKREG